ncbi:MAG TPA: ATP phosphoribosyltransferase regulatory subunit [Nitrospiria bacterium]
MTKFKDSNRPMLPKGMATFLPDAAVRKRHIEETVLSVFQSWGYLEVIPPIFEYLDVIALGMGEEMIEKGYKFVDRASGRLMLLRPDITPQIARMAAMLMADMPKPLRWYYRANVFRHEEEHAGRARELFQFGGELIGLEGPEADAEVLSVAIQCLEKIGLSGFKIAVGQVGFYKGLLESLSIPPDLHRPIHEAVIRKDRSHLVEHLRRGKVAESRVRQFASVLSLYGGEEVLAKAWKLTASPACRRALTRLREVWRILAAEGWKDHLLIDLAEVRGLNYYTGIIFEIFSRDLGVPLGGGGRYDSLIGRFGAPSPSTGFAFNLEQLQGAWEKSDGVAPTSGPDFLVLDPQKDAGRLFRTAQEIRKKGCRVVQQAGKMALKEAVARARTAGIRQVFFVMGNGKSCLVDSRTGRQQIGKTEALLSKIEPHKP